MNPEIFIHCNNNVTDVWLGVSCLNDARKVFYVQYFCFIMFGGSQVCLVFMWENDGIHPQLTTVKSPLAYCLSNWQLTDLVFFLCLLSVCYRPVYFLYGISRCSNLLTSRCPCVFYRFTLSVIQYLKKFSFLKGPVKLKKQICYVLLSLSNRKDHFWSSFQSFDISYTVCLVFEHIEGICLVKCDCVLLDNPANCTP